MQLNNLSIPTVWCDFNASGWSQEENDNCYYIFNKSSINQLDNITDIVVFAYMPENIEETLFVGCQAQIEIYEDDYRLRPIEGSWISGTPFVIQAAVEKPIFIVNNHKVAVYEREELQQRLAELPKDTLLELRMETPKGPWLCCLTHKTQAWIMFIYSSEDPGFSSRSSDTRDKGLLTFRLSNGQIDEYPKSWTIPLETAYAAIEYFWETKEKLPSIQWNDDSTE